MEVTQWIILGLAIFAVLAVYLYTRRNDGPNPWRDMGSADDELPTDDDAHQSDVLIDPSVAAEWNGFTPGETAEPALDAAPVVDEINPTQARQVPEIGADVAAPQTERVVEEAPVAQATDGTAEQATEIEQKIIVLHIVAREEELFSGEKIHAALQACQLQFGVRDIYHRIAQIDGRDESVFSIANMLKPGNLDPAQVTELETRGLVMFMVLPGPVDGNKAFHDMLQTAQDIATELGGSVLDDKRLPLTRQAAQYLIDDIAEVERRRRLAGS